MPKIYTTPNLGHYNIYDITVAVHIPTMTNNDNYMSCRPIFLKSEIPRSKLGF
jgi:hypothetical protein